MNRATGKNEQSVAGGKIENRWEVREIACPVCPGGHESGEIAKGALAPNIQSALVGIARRELNHGEGERRVEEEPGADPDCDRAWAGCGSSGNPAQADAGHHIEKHKIA